MTPSAPPVHSDVVSTVLKKNYMLNAQKLLSFFNHFEFETSIHACMFAPFFTIFFYFIQGRALAEPSQKKGIKKMKNFFLLSKVKRLT
jgi:hypothetical protein